MGKFDIGPYRVIEKLGSGGMGDVYLAHDGRLGRKVAVKAVSTERAGSPDARSRLLLEARAAATLNHPNIAAIYDIVEDGDQAYIVMEFVPGETLSARVRRGPLAVSTVLDIALQLADALESAHAAGVVHRDLKCDNVVVTEDEKVKILDFGLAKVGDDTSSSRSQDQSRPPVTPRLRGTPPYMSPEQVTGGTVDRRTDIYSLGVMLFELLSGRRPYPDRELAALRSAILSGKAPDLCGLNPLVPPHLARVVARAMAGDPADRYQTARALRNDLVQLPSGFGEDETTTSKEFASPAPSWRRWLRRPALAGAVVLAAALGLWHWLGPSALRDANAGPPVLAILAPALPGAPQHDEHLGLGIASTLESRLSRIPGLTVVALSSSLPYREKPVRIRQVGRDLGANLVLAVRVSRSGEHLQAALSVADAPTERVLWADTYAGSEQDLADLQRRLAFGVADALELRLSNRDRARLGQSPTADREAMADFVQARGYLERRDVPGNLERAVDLFHKAVTRDSRFALAHAGLAETYWRLWEQRRETKYTELAQGSATEALRLDPAAGAVHYTLAVIYRGRGRTDDAAEELRKAIELQPNADDAHRVLGEILASTGQLDEAVDHFQRAIALRPGYWDHYRGLGFAYFSAGRFADAITVFKRLTELQPDNAWGFQMLGTAYQLAGDRKSALENYRRSLDIQPNSRAWANIGLLQYQQGEFVDAIKAFQQAAKLEPSLPAHHRNLADAYARVGRRGEARQAYAECLKLLKESLEVNAKDAEVLSQLAVVEAKLERRTDAERHAAEAVAIAPADSRVRYRQAVALALNGTKDAALAALQEAIRLGYSREEARADDDLANLRNRQEYERVLRVSGGTP